MKVTRVFPDPTGETHFGEVDIELKEAGIIGSLSEPIPAQSIIFRTNEPEYDYDWHCAPARQLVVLLDGVIEIEVSDGEKRTFCGGDILLVEDVTGKGHRTRHVEPRERRSLFIVLDQ